MIATQIFDILKHVLLITTNRLGYFLNSIVENPQTPTLLQGIGLGILTIFIPMSILIMEKEREFKVLDKFVIIEYLIKPRRFICAFILVFFLPLFWSFSTLLNWIIMFASIVGDCFLFKQLKALYDWTKIKKYQYRYEYLEKQKRNEIEEECWRSVWQNKLEVIYERKFIEIFVEKIENFLKKKDLNFASDIIKIFYEEMDKRNIFIVITSGLESFIKIHYKIWRLIKRRSKKSSRNREFRYAGFLLRYLEKVFKKLRDLSLWENGDDLYSGSWWDLYCEQSETVFKNIKDEEYTSELLDLIFKDFFEKFEENPNNLDIPKEWKVTINNLKNSNIKARTIWECFKKWAWNKIKRPRRNNDFSLDYCLPMIFCEGRNTYCKLDLMALWEFISIGLYLENGVPLRDIIKSLWPYPAFGFTDIFYNPIPEEERIKKSAQLASELFGNIFQTPKLEEYLKQLEKIPPEDRNKNYTIVVTTIKNLLKFIEKT